MAGILGSFPSDSSHSGSEIGQSQRLTSYPLCQHVSVMLFHPLTLVLIPGHKISLLFPLSVSTQVQGDLKPLPAGGWPLLCSAWCMLYGRNSSQEQFVCLALFFIRNTFGRELCAWHFHPVEYWPELSTVSKIKLCLNCLWQNI